MVWLATFQLGCTSMPCPERRMCPLLSCSVCDGTGLFSQIAGFEEGITVPSNARTSASPNHFTILHLSTLIFSLCICFSCG